MSKIETGKTETGKTETGKTAPMLSDDELDAVSGGWSLGASNPTSVGIKMKEIVLSE